jgi:hypothetical protein
MHWRRPQRGDDERDRKEEEEHHFAEFEHAIKILKLTF